MARLLLGSHVQRCIVRHITRGPEIDSKKPNPRLICHFEYNVEVEWKEPDSILSFYRRLIELRRNQPALRNGTYQAVDPDNPHVLAYLRKSPGTGDSFLVVLNMSGETQRLRYDLIPHGISEKVMKPLLSAPKVEMKPVALSDLSVPPFGVLLGIVH